MFAAEWPFICDDCVSEKRGAPGEYVSVCFRLSGDLPATQESVSADLHPRGLGNRQRRGALADFFLVCEMWSRRDTRGRVDEFQLWERTGFERGRDFRSVETLCLSFKTFKFNWMTWSVASPLGKNWAYFAVVDCIYSRKIFRIGWRVWFIENKCLQ